MRLAFVLRHRRGLLMQPHHSHSVHASSSGSALKRPYAQQALAQNAPMFPSSSSGGWSSSNSDGRPSKAAKVENDAFGSSSKSYRGGPRHLAQSHRGSSKRGHISRKPAITGPVHDLQYIKSTYMQKSTKSEWEMNPKSPVANYYTIVKGTAPNYETAQMSGPSGMLWRATVTLETDTGEIVAIGDHPSQKKEAERLAALNALYQLDAQGLLDLKKVRTEKVQSQASPLEATLSDGTTVGCEKARQFMDYYCRRFNFGRPEIEHVQKQGRAAGWEVIMIVGGRKIGLGSGINKKNALMTCYVDVTQYLESCDPELWQKFVEDSRTGRDLGMAVPVLFKVNDRLGDDIYDLANEIKKSTLYKNRPRIRSLMTGDDDPATMDFNDTPAPKYVAPSRRMATQAALDEKSKALQDRRKRYLEDPAMEKMRNTRSSLPVYTKAADLLDHVRNHDITICMAATGSGKTTQIPQLILDEWIDKGDGAKCNIVCTQPRRIAAISVANRVASERGEHVGNGSIGYQVRFEAKLPEEHGSVTFCTTGIFLKRMQSALQDTASGNRSLDDVTHIVVDEVHERDVDTDLLLVVLKRLLADRKAKGKPLKVILMSATIDPKLFQTYFPDEQGKPASVIDIPGRSFPVQKHFLEEFLPQIANGPEARWVLQDDAVQKYITQELGSDIPHIPALMNFRAKTGGNHSEEDLEIPAPLIALTISHVLRQSEDGHVLVFLPGWDDIMGVQRCLQNPKGSLGVNFNTSKYSIHCLHSTVPLADQQVIFEPPPPGQRRIILATNIAETSVTIPDVVYVVDSARVKEQRYDPDRHISSLVSAWVGSSNLNQRAGRAGRHRSGEYYGILGARHADRLHPHQTVEMKRIDLSNIVMHVKALNFPGMTVEEVLAATIEPPDADRVEAAMRSLQMVGALDESKNLTSLGRVLLQLPIDAQMGRLVLFGSFFRCLDQALSLAAILTNRDPFVSPMHLKEEAALRKNSFSPEEFRSDALATLRAYNEWWAMQSRGEYVSANRFCVDNFLSKPTLLMIQKIKAHILQSLYDIGVIDVSAGGAAGGKPRVGRGELTVPRQLDVNGDSMPLLTALVAIALQPKFAVRTNEKMYRTSQDKSVFIHPSSVNHRKRINLEMEDGARVEKQIIAYSEKRQNISGGAGSNAQKSLVNTTRLDPLTYMLFGAHRVEVTRRGLDCDEWLPVIGDVDVLDNLERLKVMMESCLLRVFEGITKLKGKRYPIRHEGREDESGEEDDDVREMPLSMAEVKELDMLTQDLVRILNDYSSYRIANQSRQNSRPATPMDSPFWAAGGLPPISGPRSGYSTPRYMSNVAFSSRPSTPSRLSRR